LRSSPPAILADRPHTNRSSTDSVCLRGPPLSSRLDQNVSGRRSQRKTARPTTAGGAWRGGAARRRGGWCMPRHTASGPSRKPRSSRVRGPGAWSILPVPGADELAKALPGWMQAGLLAPGSSSRCTFPPRLRVEAVAFAAVVAGHSGASAADSHGLPCSARGYAGNLQRDRL
jgi:hypothetical protein